MSYGADDFGVGDGCCAARDAANIRHVRENASFDMAGSIAKVDGHQNSCGAVPEMIFDTAVRQAAC